MNEEIDGNSTEIPNLDHDNSMYYWDELIPIVVVYGTIFAIGLAGNGLIIFTTFRYRRMQTVTNIFFSSLASADLLLILCCIPFKVVKLFSYTWGMGEFVCKSVHYMQNVSAICSVLTLTAISIERYYVIIHPIKAKYICTISQARRVILAIWVLSFLLAVPTIYVQLHMRVGEHYKDAEYYYCVKHWEWETMWRFHEVYMLFVILIIPFSIMSFCYLVICYELWNVMERRSVMTSEHALSRDHNSSADPDQRYIEGISLTENKRCKIITGRDDTRMVKQVIYMLITVVILFVVCWAPILIDNILTAYLILPTLRFNDALRIMSVVFHLLSYSNSCINPIIYGFMSKSFRDSFVLALCCTRLRPHRGSSYSLRFISRTGSQTRQTSIKT